MHSYISFVFFVFLLFSYFLFSRGVWGEWVLSLWFHLFLSSRIFLLNIDSSRGPGYLVEISGLQLASALALVQAVIFNSYVFQETGKGCFRFHWSFLELCCCNQSFSPVAPSPLIQFCADRSPTRKHASKIRVIAHDGPFFQISKPVCK